MKFSEINFKYFYSVKYLFLKILFRENGFILWDCNYLKRKKKRKR